jgi:hypothetical protein
MSNPVAIFLRDNESLRKKLIIHVVSLLVVALVFGIVIRVVETQRNAERRNETGIQRYLNLQSVDLGDPVDRTLLRESLGLFYPGQSGRNDSLLVSIDDLRQSQFADPLHKSGNPLVGLTSEMIGRILGMYVQFLGVYLVVLVVIYLVAERIGVYRFVKMRQHRESYLSQLIEGVKRFQNPGGRFNRWIVGRTAVLALLKAVGKGVLLALLFSPAYVIAYAMKTSIDTSSILFMVLLGVISNGVLIHTANRFYTLLVAESHKGYVQTAIVKSLSSSYEWDTPDGIPRCSLLNVSKKFQSHVFRHIFLNARFQFIPALKEHASFLVTGLIIIEMALNIQGHLCYELLQQILYRQYDVACFIVFSIFFTVKATEMAIDIWHEREKRRYGY